MPDISDLSSTIISKSDQLNADQLVSGPMILTITDVRVNDSKDQPVFVYYAADPKRPYKPCLTMRKVLILAWGKDAREWIGRTMELFNEPTVMFGAEVVGGIRISRLSNISKQINVSLIASKGRKAMHEIRPLTMSSELTKVLEAISVATGSDSMQKAKKLAEMTLTADADIALALAAYKKKVKELREQAAAPPPPTTSAFDAVDDSGEITFTAEQVEAHIRAAVDADGVAVARDQIRYVKDEAARLRLTEIADARETELNA